MSRYQPILDTGLSEEAVETWSTTFEGSIVTWIISNPSPLGGPGIIVDMDEAKFGHRKYHRRHHVASNVDKSCQMSPDVARCRQMSPCRQLSTLGDSDGYIMPHRGNYRGGMWVVQ